MRTAVNFGTAMMTDLWCFAAFDISCETMMADATQAYLDMKENPGDIDTILQRDLFGFSTTGPGKRNTLGIAGMAYNLGYVTDNTSVVMPYNLALYARDQVKNVPIIGDRAYAADTEYGLYAETLILAFWKEMRNISYALLSVVMLVIGAMIMVRKKINPQLVVSVQNALPKIAIGVVLIAFSYPIGATAAAMYDPLKYLGDNLLNQIGMNIGVQLSQTLPAASELSALVYILSPVSMVVSGGAILLSIVLYLIALIVWLFVIIFAQIKQFFIYFRILVSIITAPLTFAWGTLPGNEHAITDWFKLLAARLLGVFGMYFMIAASALVAKSAFSIQVSTIALFDRIGESWQLAIAPLLSIMLLTMSLGIPKKVEEAFMGAPKKKG